MLFASALFRQGGGSMYVLYSGVGVLIRIKSTIALSGWQR